jgi:hypothetical protein
MEDLAWTTAKTRTAFKIGFEWYAAWEAAVLPLNYARKSMT